jgi:5-enolpyruvylshikimate-3-phosphate synthase
MIRELMLASKSSEVTEINFQGTPGEDIVSMAKCLEKMGVKISKKTSDDFDASISSLII